MEAIVLMKCNRCGKLWTDEEGSIRALEKAGQDSIHRVAIIGSRACPDCDPTDKDEDSEYIVIDKSVLLGEANTYMN
jgi:hypothetical protein